MKQDNLFTEKFLEELKAWKNFVPREFFYWLFKKLEMANRTVHLKKHPYDKGTASIL